MKDEFYSIGHSKGIILGFRVCNQTGRDALQPINLAPGVSELGGVGCEAFLTHTLTLVIQGSGDAKRRNVYMPSVPVGVSVVVGLLSGVSTVELHIVIHV